MVTTVISASILYTVVTLFTRVTVTGVIVMEVGAVHRGHDGVVVAWRVGRRGQDVSGSTTRDRAQHQV